MQTIIRIIIIMFVIVSFSSCRANKIQSSDKDQEVKRKLSPKLLFVPGHGIRMGVEMKRKEKNKEKNKKKNKK